MTRDPEYITPSAWRQMRRTAIGALGCSLLNSLAIIVLAVWG